MPHVSSQIRVGELSPAPLENEQVAATDKEFVRFQRPHTARQQRMQPGGSELPALSLLIASPNNSRWDAGSVRHVRQQSSVSENCTSASTVDSVFELASAGPYETPLSSAHSLFIAELEDTSPVVSSQQLTIAERSIDKQRVTKITSRAIVAIENIFAIEGDNRLLLSRAVAAEKEAKALKEENLSLQRYLDFCTQNHRPSTAPHLTLTPPPTARAASDPSPISSFNTTTDMTPGHKVRHRPSPLALSQPLKSPTRSNDLAPCPFAATPSPGRRVKTPSNHQPSPKMQPQPQPQPISRALEISNPIPGSVFRQQVTYNGTQLSVRPDVKYISLAEAQRREKPLPCIISVSPSTVPGFVEMGSIAEASAPQKEGKAVRTKKGFVGLFRWGKRQGVVNY